LLGVTGRRGGPFRIALAALGYCYRETKWGPHTQALPRKDCALSSCWFGERVTLVCTDTLKTETDN